MLPKFLLFILALGCATQLIAQKPVFSPASSRQEVITQLPTSCDPESIFLDANAYSLCAKSKVLRYSYQIDFDYNGTFDLKGVGNKIKLSKAEGLRFGRHLVRWTATDACGNSSQANKIFQILDKSKPVPVAKIVKVPAAVPGVPVELQAKSVNNFSWDNCTPITALTLRLAKKGTYSANMTLSEVLSVQTSVVFDVSKDFGLQIVALFVVDSDNNWDYVETYVELPPNPNSNGIAGLFKGNISTLDRYGIKDVIVRYETNLVEKTDAKGDYQLTPSTKVVTLVPKLEEPFLNGISVLDLLYLNRLINGVSVGATPYTKVSADMNGDKKIDAADSKILTQLITGGGNSDSLPAIWRFVPKNYVFTSDTLNFPEFIVFDTLDKKSNIDFYGIKVGKLSSTQFQEATDREAIPKMPIIIENQQFVAGTKVKVSLLLPASAAYSYTIEFDPQLLMLTNVEGIDQDNYSLLRATDGIINLVYLDGDAGGGVPQLTFTARQVGELQGHLAITSKFTAAQFVGLDGEVSTIQLQFTPKTTDSKGLLAFPNPFSNSTTLKLFATKAEMIEFKLHEANGRLVWSRRFPVVAGWNEVHLEASELPGGGTYYIQAKMEQGVLTEKLIYLH